MSDRLRPPVDDPDEETVADNLEPDDEPTTIRPTPIPPDLVVWEAATVKDNRTREARGRIGKYELYSRLAKGAFGVVYSAHDPSLDRSVALKVLRPTHLTNQEVVQRFLQEARATARVAHPGIVTIHDCGMVETRRGPTAFIAMELLSGESLTHRLARACRLEPIQACEIVRQVASALEAAHHVDVLHRDLKPDNIYLVPDPAMPSGERVKVLDFGLAKLGTGGQTQLQTVFGTPRYMSPEQTRSATQIDHRSDIYTLGCILFELVTGRTPFDGDVRQLLERHQRATPPRAGSMVPDLPPVLDELIADMLAKDPMGRPQTMGGVQRALRFAIDSLALEAAVRPEAAASLVLPLPPGTPGPVIAPPPVRPPSSPPIRLSTRPPSSPPIRLPTARPPSSPPVQPISLPSVEVSITAPPAGAVEDDRQTEPVPTEAMSGELVVPASPHGAALPHGAPLPHPAAPYAPAQFPDQLARPPMLVGLCLLVIAVLTAIAVAATV